MTTKKGLLAYGLALLLAGLAHGSDLDEFTRLDVDQDGKLSSAEHAKQIEDRRGARSGVRKNRPAESFAKADSDGDGYLSLSEFTALSSQRGSRDRT